MATREEIDEEVYVVRGTGANAELIPLTADNSQNNVNTSTVFLSY